MSQELKPKQFEDCIGNYYIPYYEGNIEVFCDPDGTFYTVNKQLAKYHYKWTNGRYGIGYYLQTSNDEY